MRKGVSIVICCYNSEKVIGDTLVSIANLQRSDGVLLEVLIVDNNCSDNTVQIAEKIWQTLHNPFPLRILTEARPGLNFARKTGVFACNYEYLIFCDDDNRLDFSYAKIVFDEFEANATIGVLGGWSDGIYEIEKPSWFDAVKTSYAVGGDINLDMENPQFVWGAGMSLRSDLAKKIFSETFKTVDRSGNSLSAGGDLEICDLARKYNYRVRKKKTLKFSHYITRQRLTWKYCTRLYEGFGYSTMEYQKLENRNRWKMKAAIIKTFILFVLKNPVLSAKGIFRAEGDLRTLQYYSLLGALKSSLFN